MCMKTECEKCSKPTWKGCGKHIEQALKDVPEDERCKCPRETCEATAAKKVEETTTSSDIKHEEATAAKKIEETTTSSGIRHEEAKVETKIDHEVKAEVVKTKED